MIVLDENILDGQRLMLDHWSIRNRQIGVDLATKGIKDDAVIVLLRTLRQPTFITRDLGFYVPTLKHPRYAIVVAAVGQYEVAAFVRRFLRHPEFNAFAKRTGRVIRISSAAITWWQTRSEREMRVTWDDV